MPHGSATYGSAANVSSSSIQTYGVAFYGRNGFGGEKGERERELVNLCTLHWGRP